MVDKSVGFARRAAEQGARVMCFQELFNGPYFCQVQDDDHKDTAEASAGRPHRAADDRQAAKETGDGAGGSAVYEKEDDGFLYNTAAVIDADGAYLGKYRKTHIPHLPGFWEKFYFRPGNLGYPVFDTAAGRIGVYICYDRHFPEGWRALGLGGGQDWCSTRRPPAGACPCTCGTWSNPPRRWPTSFSSGPSTGWEPSPTAENDFYGSSYFVDPRADNWWATPPPTPEEELVVRDLDMDMIDEVRKLWAFYRDRRPDAYDSLTAP